MSFETEFITSITNNINNYYLDNYDHIRYGKKRVSLLNKIKRAVISQVSKLNYFANPLPEKNEILTDENFIKLKYLYDLLSDEQSKKLLVDVLSYRLLGRERVKLPLNKEYDFFDKIKKIDTLADKSKTFDTVEGFKIYLYNLTEIGRNLSIYFNSLGVFASFIVKQYEYHNLAINIKGEKGDIVLDCGGCWGDTSLYFADEVGADGRVYTFEFIPANLEIIRKNLDLNPRLKDLINLVENPVWDKSDEKIHYKALGPSSSISPDYSANEDTKNTVLTLAIDDLVSRNSIPKVNFIKMDIEGAELNALKGAENTIRKFKPKLAISLYHSIADFERIPKWINDLNLGYSFYLGHYTIHSEETILFANPAK